MRAIRRVSGAIGTLVGVLSTVKLLQHAFDLDFGGLFAIIIDYYESLRAFVLAPLLPLVAATASLISALIGVQWSLAPVWMDIFVLLLLYFGARARAYWDSNNRVQATTRAIIGLPVALLAAVFGGVSPTPLGLPTIVALVGLMIYDLATSALDAAAYRPNETKWLPEFRRYLSFSLPANAVAAGGAVVVAVLLIAGFMPTVDVSRFDLVLFVVMALFLAGYWGFRGWILAVGAVQSMPGETKWNRFRRSSTTRIAVTMSVCLLGAAFYIILDAGF